MLKTLDILIGATTVVLVFSMAVTVITQAITAYFGRKGKHLRSGLAELLGQLGIEDPFYANKIATAVLTHPMVSAANGKLGTVVHREEFTKLLLDLASGEGASNLDSDARDALLGVLKANGVSDPQLVLKNVRAMALQLEASNPELATDVRQSLAILHEGASDFVARVNSWFDQTIDRVSERFANYTHWITLGIATVVVLAVQLDMIAVIDRLSIDDQFRNAFVANATSDYSKETLGKAVAPQGQPSPNASPTVPQVSPDAYYNLLGSAGLITLPSGSWFQQMTSVRKYPGMLLSILMISLGAPFWYNILKNLLGLRPAIAQKDDMQRLVRQTTQTVPDGEAAGASEGTPAVPRLLAGEAGDLTATG